MTLPRNAPFLGSFENLREHSSPILTETSADEHLDFGSIGANSTGFVPVRPERELHRQMAATAS